MSAWVPQGWPDAVHPPGSESWEATAVEFLLDVLPPEFRQYGVLRRHPVALASMARYYAGGCVEGARAGYRAARRELAEHVPPHAVDELLRAYRTEGFRLAATSQGVVLVEQALRGEVFRQPLLSSCPGRPGLARARRLRSCARQPGAGEAGAMPPHRLTRWRVVGCLALAGLPFRVEVSCARIVLAAARHRGGLRRWVAGVGLLVHGAEVS